MATPYHIQVPTPNSGLLKVPQTDEAAAKVSDLLQQDLEKHHVFFNPSGFHNHITHHILSVYGTGGSASAIQAAYDANASYQLKSRDPRPPDVEGLRSDWNAHAGSFLGKGAKYADWLRFFQLELDDAAKDGGGWKDVVVKWLFAGNARSNDLLGRMFGGVLHPIIQLMYGVEWQQPAIVAEGLAQAAVHSDTVGVALRRAEERAAERRQSSNNSGDSGDSGDSNDKGMGSIVELFESIKAPGNEKLASSVRFSDSSRILDGVLARAPDEAIELMSRVRVDPDEVEERTAEMFLNSVCIAIAAAMHPPHVPKYDFFLIHHANLAPLFLTLSEADWLTRAQKARLLEYKIRADMVDYIARGCPPLSLDGLSGYVPSDEKKASKDGGVGAHEVLATAPEALLPRFHALLDDGHTIKLVRAMMLARGLAEKYDGRPWVRLRGGEAWMRALYMLLDGVEGQQTRWVRSAGFDEAWGDIPKAE